VTDGDYTCHGERWALCRIVEPICHTLETNITLYVNYISIKILCSDKTTIKRNSDFDGPDHVSLWPCNSFYHAPVTFYSCVAGFSWPSWASSCRS